MAVTLSKLQKKEAEVSIDLGGGDILNITYNPNMLTPKTEAERKARILAGETTMAVFVDAFPTFILKWDLLEDDGETPKPITTETFLNLSENLILVIWKAISSDTSPGK